MVENKDLKKVRLLYVVVIGLIMVIIAMFFYFNNKIDILQKHAESNSTMSINIFKRLNEIVELNQLDTANYRYLVNPSNWEEILKNETAMTLNDLNNYKISEVVVKEDTDLNILKVINKHVNDEGINPHTLNPNYLKLTEAEEKLKEK